MFFGRGRDFKVFFSFLGYAFFLFFAHDLLLFERCLAWWQKRVHKNANMQCCEEEGGG